MAREPGAALQLGVWANNVAARAFYARLGGREVEAFEAPTEGGGTASQLRVRWERAAELLPDARHVPGTEEKSHVPGTEEKS